ncbi:hypothetical protein [Gemmobacter denitrificans]|uniref:Uncharacterized protein n=1 Tax=Gemmobacter denitrificans TaxID=3123040 RepID=A0ABU8BYS8_9RHOB
MKVNAINSWRHLTTVSILIVALLIGLLAHFNSSQIGEKLSSLLLFLAGTICSAVITYIYSGGDKTIHLTYDRLMQLVSGAELAGLDRVESTLKYGTKAEKACELAKTSIDFIGVGGTKFLPQILDESSKLGRKIAAGEVKVRIMLLDPAGTQISNWTKSSSKQERVKSDIGSSIEILRPRLSDTLQARVYDFLPPLRMLIIDGNQVYISRYDPASDTGWDAPQLCFSNRESTDSAEFSVAFRNLYSLLWSNGKAA